MCTPDPTLRLYAIMRHDLDMTPGKMAAQAGHAFLDTWALCLKMDEDRAHEYHSDSHGTKVVLCAESFDQFMEAYELAKASGLPCALIVDSGHVMPPHFDGSHIVTAFGIGPARREEISHITNRFATYR